MAEKTKSVLIVGSFVITGASAEAIEAVSKLFTWNKQILIEDLATAYDPDDNEEFAIELTPEDPGGRPSMRVIMTIDPKDILNLDDIIPKTTLNLDDVDPYEWTPVEVFTKLCNKNHVYSFKDTLFAQGGKPSGAITGSISGYALGYFGDDHDEEGISFCPYIKASCDEHFKPTYCKLIKY